MFDLGNLKNVPVNFKGGFLKGCPKTVGSFMVGFYGGFLVDLSSRPWQNCRYCDAVQKKQV